eukprot:7281451-Lingulodinium_polyedra.AAC.1
MSNHPCSGLSNWVHQLLRPMLSRLLLPDFIQDTTELLQLFELIRSGSYVSPWSGMPFSSDSTPFTLDVVSMFTNIPTQKGTEACQRAWALLLDQHFPNHPVSPELVGRV